ncbi:hypothetical protein BUALT_Bualt09G0046200 [Buddleja alternifolia]|uniref:Retrotransposon gag domain-containing protein n=1 Tax=Buddleja alternifolia TaxID=168488 RepID=A0AAV6X002_9LAMI|nr:hypothetical protein BUALT_Bualt09G0046200 [Buddleja alternifolia]
MAKGLHSLDNRKELDAIREQITANALKSDKMFENIQNLIAAMATNPNPLGSAATMDNEGHSPAGRGVVDETPLDTRVCLAAVYLEGKALQWHQIFMRNWIDKRMPIWGEYVTVLHDRFGSLLFEDPMSELMNLRQTRSVREYLDKFDERLNNVNLTESYVVSCFLGSLKGEIEVQVRMFKPKNLQEAVCLAKLKEQALILAHKRNHTNTKPQPFQKSPPLLSTPSSYTSPMPSTQYPNHLPKPNSTTTSTNKPGRRITSQEIDEKRAKGLCFLCDEKYTKDHNCPKRKQLFLMEFSEDQGDSSDNEQEEQQCWGHIEEHIDTQNPTSYHISMNAMNGIHDFRTMRVHGSTKDLNHAATIPTPPGDPHHLEFSTPPLHLELLDDLVAQEVDT